MSKYTTTSILFAIILMLTIIQVQNGAISAWYIFLPLAFYALVLLIGSAKIGLNFFFKSLIRSDTTEKLIAISFDDGPHPEVTPKLLQVLEKYEAKATFFLIGENAQKYPQIVKDIIKNDHLTGNHSFSHQHYFDLLSSKKMLVEIDKTNKAISDICKKKPLLFRPPFGVTNPSLRKAIESTGMISVGWSLRSFDTIKSSGGVLRKLKRKTSPGDVVLFHDTDMKIIGIMEEYLKWLKDQHYKVVSLESLFNINAYETD